MVKEHVKLSEKCAALGRMVANTPARDAADARDLARAAVLLREAALILRDNEAAARRGQDLRSMAYGAYWDLRAVDARLRLCRDILVRVRDRSPLRRKGETTDNLGADQICILE